MIGCACDVCRSDDPRDRRTRASAVFEFDGHRVLIDTSPELRLQCIAADIDSIDAVLFTHHHADHVVGLDDVRVFCERGEPLAVYAAPPTLDRLRAMFAYAFDHDDAYPSAIPRLAAHSIDGPFELFGRRVTPIPLWHGPLPILGFRIGDVAYCTDCNAIPEESLPLLANLDVLVLDGLR
ncbi:MAG: MBL fold metallo-hydrolase, partial [Planctomycetota bacterium]